jgi:DNA-directed RNA polymerase subunit L/DNA-directed RNA polymerase alpha subunit
MASTFQNLRKVSENEITFTMNPTNVAYANTIRRLILTYVPMVGFRADMTDKGTTTDVEILANSTPMTNEMFAHRIGLIPIHLTEWSDEDASSHEFVCSVTNENDQTLDVTTGDIRVFKVDPLDPSNKTPVDHGLFFKADKITGDHILLASLKPKVGDRVEEVRFKARASVGTGREHARFIPTSRCTYVYTPDTNEEHIKEVFERWLIESKKVDPASLKEDNEREEALKREFNTMEIQRCYLKNEETDEPYSFDFTIESIGVYNPVDIVRKGLEAGKKLCESYAGVTLPQNGHIEPADARILAYDFILRNEDHTFGHLIQAWIDENLLGKSVVTYVGYDIPHPLKDIMVIRIGVSDNNEESARTAFRDAAKGCAALFEGWLAAWNATAYPSAATAKLTRKPIRLSKAP